MDSRFHPSAGLTSAPVAATHGSECACRHCASQAYADLLSKSDYQRHELTRLTDEVSRLTHELALEKARRLSVEIDLAIQSGDRESWAALVAERAGLTISTAELERVVDAVRGRAA